MQQVNASGEAQDARWQELVRGPLSDLATPFEEHWAAYEATFTGRPAEAGPPRVWRPDAETVAASNLEALRRQVGASDYAALHRWSTTDRPAFWGAMLERLGIPFHTPPEQVLDDSQGAEHPRWLPGARMNIADACFQASPDRVAVLAASEDRPEPRPVTYGELQDLADRVAAGCRALGLQPGDAVALYLPMNVECVAAYLGIVKAGLAVVSIPDSFAPPEVATRMRLGGAKAIITVATFRRGGKDVPLYPKVVEAEAPTAIIIGDPPAERRSGDLLWDDFLQDTDATGAASTPCAPDDVTNILFSSGTTGDPKAIPWTHLTPIKAAADGHLHQDIHPEDVVAWPTNIGWMMGPWLIYATFVNQATMALFEGAPNTPAFTRFVKDSKVTMLGLVPAIVRAWRAAGAVTGDELAGVRIYSSTGEASNTQDYLWLMSRSRYLAPVIEYCGGTEIGGGHLTGTVVQPQCPATFSTPAMGLDFVILDEADQPIEAGGMGELYLVPPSMGLSQRLLNRDHHDEYYAGTPAGPGGALLRRHGDEVSHLHGGYYQAHGRADDTMNLGGIKVSSVELERVMDQHPSIKETAAVATTPPGGGAEQLVVYAVAATGATADALRPELQALIKKELNPLFRVSDVVLVDALPRTASNKVMRRELRRSYDAPAQASA
ncbi:MAG: AMP-binding protein [Thermoplasmatota archaeon]